MYGSEYKHLHLKVLPIFFFFFFNRMQPILPGHSRVHTLTLSSELRWRSGAVRAARRRSEAGGGFACAAQVDGERFQGFTEANGNVCGPTSARAAVCGRLVLIAALHKYVESSWALPAQLEHLQVQFFFLFFFSCRHFMAHVKHQHASRLSPLARVFPLRRISSVGICWSD